MSAMGMQPDDARPFDPTTLRPGALVADIMKPKETGLLRMAPELGHPVHFGEPTLQHQLELFCAYFGFHRRPPLETAQPGEAAAKLLSTLRAWLIQAPQRRQ